MMSKIEIKCAFCQGRGIDPFDLLSENAACQVCGGIGKVEVIEPAIRCLFCKGTGIYPRNARVTCTVCGGKGSVTVKGKGKECPECKGTAVRGERGLPCSKCGGKGVISEK